MHHMAENIVKVARHGSLTAMIDGAEIMAEIGDTNTATSVNVDRYLHCIGHPS